MTRFASGIFYLGLGLLFTHEMDAMPNHEWRVLPLTSFLDDATGQWVFVVAHVPLFAVVIAFVASLNPGIRARTRMIASAFLIVHAILHYLFTGHPDYEFSSLLSSFLIYGAAACGLLYILSVSAGRRST